MSLYPYLVAISHGKPINAHRFSTLLEAKKIAMSQLGNAVYKKKNKYLFNVENKELFEKLLSKTYHQNQDSMQRNKVTHINIQLIALIYPLKIVQMIKK